MSATAGSRKAKQALFDEIATVSKALGSGRRLEIIDILANGERSVEEVAEATGLTIANASRHLQQLKAAGLVGSRRDRQRVIYSLAGPDVFELWRRLRAVARASVPAVEHHARRYLGDRGQPEPVSQKELLRLLESRKDVVILDVRPKEEYESGHIPGAVSIPLDELPHRIRTLDKTMPVIVYCRGPYCAFADQAVEVLRARGFHARRMEDGWPEWQAAGFPVERNA